MTDRELMQQALECTPHKQLIDELLDSRIPKTEREHAAAREIEKLRERLAQPEQEPVACIGTNGELMWLHKPQSIYSKARPLYTSPPQRKPLTEEEIGLLTTDPRFAHIETPTLAEFARAVIAKATGEKE